MLIVLPPPPTKYARIIFTPTGAAVSHSTVNLGLSELHNLALHGFLEFPYPVREVIGMRVGLRVRTQELG